MIETKNKSEPSYVSGLMWFAFSATAMLSAVILPIQIYALPSGYDLNVDTIFHKTYFSVLLIAALYHGLYRTKTIIFDLGIKKYSKIINVMIWSTFIIFSGLAIKIIFSP